jgi:hypothetical protein
MRRTIQDHDLIPLKKEIEKINEVTSTYALTFEYIDYLEKQNIDFSFKQLPFHTPTRFYKDKKQDFINMIKQKKHGYISLKDNEYKQVTSECFLDTFIGKDFYELEKFFHHIDFREEICEFYRTFGLIALSKNEKKLYSELIKPFNSYFKYDIGLILYRSNLPYLMKNHTDLFKNHDLNYLCEEWFKKVNSFETYKVNKNKNTHNIGNIFYSKAQSFTLKLAGLIIFKQSNKIIENLINEYEDILSQRIVFDFFKENKCQETSFSFHIYRKHIENYKVSEISIETVDLLQKNLTVDINSIMKKHLLNYDKCSYFLRKIHSFFITEEDFKHTTIFIDEENKKCTISLASAKSELLQNGELFLHKTLNEKELFISPEKYKSSFYYFHFNNKFEVKNIKSLKSKI